MYTTFISNATGNAFIYYRGETKIYVHAIRGVPKSYRTENGRLPPDGLEILGSAFAEFQPGWVDGKTGSLISVSAFQKICEKWDREHPECGFVGKDHE